MALTDTAQPDKAAAPVAGNAVPLDSPSPTGTPDPVYCNANLEKEKPQVYQDLMSIVKKLSNQLLFARRMQIYRAGRAELYKLGKQTITWDGLNENWVGVTSQGAFLNAFDDEVDDDDWVTNFYGGFAEHFETTISENVPPIIFIPEDTSNPDDVSAAKNASLASELIARNNDAPMLMGRYAHHSWTGGLIATYTRTVTDGNRFGWEVDPDTGEPLLQNGQKVPKSQVVITVHGALDITLGETPDDDAELDHLGFHMDIPFSKARAMYPWIKEITQSGQVTEDDLLARLFRTSVRANVLPRLPAESLDQIVTWVRIWLKPSTYFNVTDDERRAALIQMFPDGVAMHFLGGTFSAAIPESMGDHWRVKFVKEGRGTKRPGIGEDFIQVQDQINILSNLWHEYLIRVAPIVYYRDKAINGAALNKMEARPGLHVPVTLSAPDPSAAPLGNLFFVKPAADVPESLIQRLNDLSGSIGQFITGIYPALLGAGLPAGLIQETAEGFQRQIEQSMGRIARSYRYIRSLHQQTMDLAVREFCNAQKAAVPLTAPGKKSKLIDPLSMRKGCFKIFPEADEGYPILFRDKREQLRSLLTNPAFGPSVGLSSNLKLIRRIQGFNEFEIAGEKAQSNQAQEIDDLVSSQPIMPDPQAAQVAMVSGQQPPEPQPSIGIGPLDNHAAHFQQCMDWYESEEGQEAKITNPLGFQNVILHAMLHKAQMPVPPPPWFKPISVTANLKDMPDEAVIEELAKRGVQVAPQSVEHTRQQQKERPVNVPVPVPVPMNGGNNG